MDVGDGDDDDTGAASAARAGVGTTTTAAAALRYAARSSGVRALPESTGPTATEPRGAP